MSNNVRLKVLLEAVDRASRPFKAIQNASLSLTSDISDTQAALRVLDGQAARINGFRAASAQLAATGQSLARAKQEAAALAISLNSTRNPTQEQVNALAAARKSAADLKREYNGLRQSIQRQRSELALAGINTRTLAADERRLKNNISEKTQQLNRQREALARVQQQQDKITAVKNRYESGKQLASRAYQAGSRGTALARAGFEKTASFIAPGVSLEKQMSGIQASLGLEKGDVRLDAIRQQARAVSGETGVSSGDVARVQSELARSGYDADALLAATAPAVNLSLAGGIDPVNAADLLGNTQLAFNLASSDAGRVADVLTRGSVTSQTHVSELGDAVTTVAPAAGAAGVSLEEATALLGILTQKGVKGAAAGAELSQVLNRLQNPDGLRALNALKVPTRDGRGNPLPVENILNAISVSFEKNRLDAGQQAKYLADIFGQESARSAGMLVSAAGNGSLSEKHQQLMGAKGSAGQVAQVQTDNLDGDLNKLQSVWNGLKMDVFIQADGILRSLTVTATEWLTKISAWVNNNPALTQGFIGLAVGAQAFVTVLGGLGLAIGPILTGVNLIVAGAGMLGTVFSVVGGSIMAILGGLTLPIVAIGAAIAAGALLIVKYWEPISAFFSGVIQGLSAAFGPIGEMFSPVLKVFDYVAEKLGGIWQWFTDLVKPIKTTQDTLDSCKDAGVIFGQVLGDALKAPLTLFNSLSGKASWLLEKLGVIKKESGNLDSATDKAASDNTAPGQSSPYIPPTSIYGGYQGYQPTLVGGGRSYVNQSKNEFNLTWQGGAASGPDLARQIQEAIENSERDKERQWQSSYLYG